MSKALVYCAFCHNQLIIIVLNFLIRVQEGARKHVTAAPQFQISYLKTCIVDGFSVLRSCAPFFFEILFIGVLIRILIHAPFTGAFRPIISATCFRGKSSRTRPGRLFRYEIFLSVFVSGLQVLCIVLDGFRIVSRIRGPGKFFLFISLITYNVRRGNHDFPLHIVIGNLAYIKCLVRIVYDRNIRTAVRHNDPPITGADDTAGQIHIAAFGFNIFRYQFSGFGIVINLYNIFISSVPLVRRIRHLFLNMPPAVVDLV